MIKALREFRLIPVVLLAAVCLLALKLTGLLLDGGYTLRLAGDESPVTARMPSSSSITLQAQTVPLNVANSQANGQGKSWMRENFNYPDVTGSVPSPPPPAKDANAAAKPPAPPAGPAPDARSGGTKVSLDAPPRPASAAERALLERLQQRRQELDARARELEARENLLAAAEKKLEARTADEKGEGKGGAGQRKDDPDARFKGLVTMYETMKPKEAAKIFDRLDIRILLDVASQINPRVMSAILAQMTPEAAERLTVELAARGNASERSINPNDLPKIEGRPTN
jgi:flagellar motility protein MotE (MotC chaperone)